MRGGRRHMSRISSQLSAAGRQTGQGAAHGEQERMIGTENDVRWSAGRMLWQ